MLKFFDIYLKTNKACKLKDIHEIEHKIFLIPDLANIYDDRHSITNGMSYSRGIRFSIITKNKNSLEKFKNFFQNINKYDLPEWSKEEKSRFEAEEKEWEIRQRQYFGSFATKCFEEEFDKINNIKNLEIKKNLLKENFLLKINSCENHKLNILKEIKESNFLFPNINKNFFWEENGNMIAIILPIFKKDYKNFIFFSEWIKKILEENLVFKGKIYDLDFFNVYENEYILGITHFYSPENIKTDFLKNIFLQKPTKKDFDYIKETLTFELEKQKFYFDQEANVVMGFSINDEKKFIRNTSFKNFISNYDFFLNFLTKNKFIL